MEAQDDGVWFRFELPPGSYATVFLSQFVKLEEVISSSSSLSPEE